MIRILQKLQLGVWIKAPQRSSPQALLLLLLSEEEKQDVLCLSAKAGFFYAPPSPVTHCLSSVHECDAGFSVLHQGEAPVKAV